MKILAIDPGTTKSAYVVLDKNNFALLDYGIVSNQEMLTVISRVARTLVAWHCVVEMVESYGMAVGKTVFETVYWTGRFCERWDMAWGGSTRIYRRDVKKHLCNSMRAKDANVRQALIDMYPATGGGKIPQIGTKKNPGPLYGVSADVWAALGVGVTYAAKLDTRTNEQKFSDFMEGVA